MGQYYFTVNLDKREFINPHLLGDGLKLLEQCGYSVGGTNDALHLLLACSSGRGGGDFQSENEWIGRWAGDRIAVVGDYADDECLAPEHKAGSIYSLCHEHDDEDDPECKPELHYRDITEELIPTLEREYEIVYAGDGWRQRVSMFKDIEGFQSSWGVGDRTAQIDGEGFPMSKLRDALKVVVQSGDRRRGEKITLRQLKAAGLK